MTSPDERADNSARNDAIELVDNALKSGRIVQADHDWRVDQLERAQTMQEIDLQVRDLRPPGAAATTPIPAMSTVTVGGTGPGGTPGPHDHPWPLVNYGPGSPGSAEAAEVARVVTKGGKVIGGVVALIVLVSVIVPIVGVVIAFFAARDSFPDFGDIGPTDETTYLPGQAPGEDGVNVHTVEGYHELVEAVSEETGETFAYSAVLYPRYASLEIPTGTNDRYENFYWDGEELTLNTIKGTTDAEQFDMSLVDPDQMIDMLNEVRGRLDSPTSWYVIISDRVGTEAQISAYASNEFSETSYLIQNLDGTVVYDSEAAP